MTAVSTVLGMVPVAFGTGDGSEWRSPMGLVCIGGLVTSTLLTLLVVPVFYTLLAQGQEALSRAARRVGLVRRPSRRSLPPAPARGGLAPHPTR
jgi:HAE1 family hydrophobic/amphiphilic exporter-1